ncbi:unnamed protein product, partial [Rotaria magnacalcarata]
MNNSEKVKFQWASLNIKWAIDHLPPPSYAAGYKFHFNHALFCSEYCHDIKQRVVTEATPIGRIYDEELAKAQLSQTALSIVASTKDA